MAKKAKHYLKQAILFPLIFILIVGWVFSGWPQIFNFPPKIQEAYAASPVVQTRSTTTTNGNPLTVTLPTGSSDGDLIIILLQDGAIGDTWLQAAGTTGWTEMYDSSGQAAYYKQIGASEANPAFDSLGGGRMGASALRITGHEDPATQAPEVSTGATGTSANPDPDTVTPTGGAKDYLWIALDGNTDGRRTVSTCPASPDAFTNLNAFASGGGGGGSTGATCEFSSNAASIDPGTFALGGSSPWEARTLVVHPGAAAVVSITVLDGVVAYGIVADNTSQDTTASGVNDTQKAVNTGDVTVDFSVQGTDSAAWELDLAVNGTDQYTHEISTNGGTVYMFFDELSFRDFATGIPTTTSQTQTFDLRILTPNPSTNFDPQNVNVTIQATAS